MNYHKQIFNFLIFILITSINAEVSASEVLKVEIVHSNGAYQLYRGGKPYLIKGAGLVSKRIDSLASHGGNSLRNWTTVSKSTNTQDLLDSALAEGVTVSLCLSMGTERTGFDYDNPDMVAAQFEKARAEVLKYRAHPALLTWIIGNELNHDYTNPKVYDAVNDVSKMIHALDPNHPTTTTLAGLKADALKDVDERATDLDFVSLQAYGSLNDLPDFIKQTGYTKPFMVTEWGTIGYWEMEKTTWGAPVELNSSEKANNYLFNYNSKLKAVSNQLIGSYAFLWGQKQERTATWFGLFTEAGEETETVDVMHYIWNGSWPSNRSPSLKSMTLDGKSSRQNVMLKVGENYTAVVDAFDHEDDELSYKWQVKPTSRSKNAGGDFEENIKVLQNVIENPHSKLVQIKAPTQTGAYRLFVYVYDGKGHAAHANIPFYVKH
jgi:hypothetical protein